MGVTSVWIPPSGARGLVVPWPLPLWRDRVRGRIPENRRVGERAMWVLPCALESDKGRLISLSLSPQCRREANKACRSRMGKPEVPEC